MAEQTTANLAIEPTPMAEIDRLTRRVAARKDAWRDMPPARLAAFADRLIQDFAEAAGAWTRRSCKAKGLAFDAPEAGQEWLAGPYVALRNLRLLRRSLKDIARHGAPRLPGRAWTRPNGQVAVPVFPVDLYDRLFFYGTTAETWMAPDVDLDRLAATIAPAYRDPPEPALCLVLGAGNVSSIGPMDAFYKLFVERKTAVIKTHPANAYLGPAWAHGFAALIEEGFVAIVHGDAAEGEFLCRHESVDEIHITGSDKTHDRILFGADTAANKAARRLVLDKPISSELGNVSPVIVAPGRWTEAQLQYHGENVATSLANNAGFNCNASRVLITHAAWPQRAAFLEAIRASLRRIRTRKAYYPGAAERHQRFLDCHPRGEIFGEGGDGRLPWLMITGVDPAAEDEICFQTEAFCGVFAETALPAEDAADFLAQAAGFANERLWGTLNATILAPPSTPSGALEACVAALRYGTVSINHWAAVGYGLGSTPWGAFPGHDAYRIESGQGVVHNAFMLGRPQKSVVRGPFVQWPKPAWFASHRMSHEVGRRLTAFEARPSPWRTPGILAAALRR